MELVVLGPILRVMYHGLSTSRFFMSTVDIIISNSKIHETKRTSQNFLNGVLVAQRVDYIQCK